MKPSISQIREAIKFENSTPNGTVYFLGNMSRKDRIKQNLASKMFYDECHKLDAYGCFEIYKVLLEKKISPKVVKFFVDTKNGGSTELDIISAIYGYGDTKKTLEEIFNEEMYLYNHTDYGSEIRKAFDGFVKITELA